MLLLISVALEVLARVIKQELKQKAFRLGKKKEVKPSLLEDDMKFLKIILKMIITNN